MSINDFLTTRNVNLLWDVIKEDDLNKEDEQMISDENVKIDPQMNNSVE